jgi:20S proteasome alpha/beta subunit
MDSCEFANGNVVVLYSPVGSIAGSEMTLIVAIKASDAIVLAADGRVTSTEGGSILLESDNAQKLYDFGHFGLGIAGFRGLGEDIIRRLHNAKILESCRGIGEAKENVGRFLYCEYQDRYSNTPAQDWPDAALMLVGYEPDRTQRIYRLYSQRGFQAAESTPDAIGSSPACICTRLLITLVGGLPNSLETDSRPSVEHAKALAVTTIRLTSRIDLRVGGTIQLALVEPSGYSDKSNEVPNYEGYGDHMVELIRNTLRGEMQG